MDKGTFLLLGAMALIGFTTISFATTAGYFTCPSGQTEDLYCAASCCESYGGTYSYSDETCELASSSDWASVSQCESNAGCCVSAGSSNPYSSSSSSGCCGTGFLLGAVAVGAFAASGRK